MTVAVTRICKRTVQLRVRSGNHMNADQFTYASSPCRTRVRCGLYRADVTAHKNSDVTCTDIFFADQYYVCGFYHRVGGFNRADKTLCLDHSESFVRHFSSCVSAVMNEMLLR